MKLTLLARGGVPVQLDRERILFYDLASSWVLYQKHGEGYLQKLMAPGDQTVIVRSPDALLDLLCAGLQKDAEEHGETLTPEQVSGFLNPFNLGKVAGLVVQALGSSLASPEPPGKASAAAASPAEAAAKQGPGPTRVSTSMRRNASPSPSSAGRRKSSGGGRSGSSTSRVKATSRK